MMIEGAKLTPNAPASVVKLNIESPREFEKSLGQQVPAVFVVDSEHLTTIREFKEIVEDRETKDSSRELKRFFLGRKAGSGKLLVLEAQYRAWGKLKSSLEAFMKQLQKSQEKGLYLVGTRRSHLKELLEKSCGHSPGESVGRGREGMRPLPVDVEEKLTARFIGVSPQAERVRRLIYRASRVDNTVLILGETGTGKQVVADGIHDLDALRRQKVFRPLNCAAVTQTLFESELFGHDRGAFHGADRSREGIWKSADGGTLFLDEIGDLHLESQAKILRALETNLIRPVGSDREILVKSVRVIAATNRDLDAMVKAGQFREDLYYRLVEFLIRTPSLRDHPEDIEPLAQHFWQTTVGNSERLSSEIIDLLKRHKWPGNARELKLVLKALSVHCLDEKCPTARHLAFVFRDNGILAGPFSHEGEALRQIETLRHLRRVDEVLLTWRIKVLPLVEDGFAEEQRVREALSWMGFRLDELKDLCRESSIFGGEDLFLMIHGLVGKMTVFQDLLRENTSVGLHHWNAKTAEEFERVRSKLSQEINRVQQEARDYGL